MKRAALYMRVSTKGHGQTTETQALALRDYAAHRGFEITEEYRDEGISGGKDSRPALDRLMKDARTRKFDLVIVARFDRFARSVSHLLPLIKERVHMGISRARKQGKRLGRPKRVFDREKAKTMLQSMSVREVARALGVSRGVIERTLSGPSHSSILNDSGEYWQ